MARTAINLYSVRDLDEPMLDIVDRVDSAGYDGVQFSGGFRDASVDEIMVKLDETGLDVTAAHLGIDDMEEDLEAAVAPYEAIGCDSVVVPWLSAAHFESEEAVLETANRLNELADRLAERDLGLHYHNHDHEFTDLGDTTGFELLLDETEFGVELDVGWVETAGHDPVELLRSLGDRADLVHMKDMADGEFCEIGTGDVDMQACADVAEEIGSSWLIYEHDQPDDPAASIDVGAEFLGDL